MNNYTWDIEILIKYILPAILRNARMEAWLLTLLNPLDDLHTNFVEYVEAKRYELDFTGQVISLERLLNNEFDNALRRIYITDGNRAEVFIFSNGGGVAEGNEIFIFNEPSAGNESLIFMGESNLLHDFIVNIPSGLAYDSGKLNTLIRKYKLAGKKYIINIY